MNKHTESLVLTELFFSHVKGFEKDKQGKFPGTAGYKKAVLSDAYACLSSGLSFVEIRDFITANHYGKDFYAIQDYLKKAYNESFNASVFSRQNDEQIELGHFYIHPLTQETAKPPVYCMNMKTMTIEELPGEPFFLEIKDSLTTQDILNYYLMRHEKVLLPGTGMYTQMNRMLSNLRLDFVLFMIDASATSMHDDDKSASTPAYLMEFYDEAKRLYYNRKTISIEGGLLHVQPRAIYRTDT